MRWLRPMALLLAVASLRAEIAGTPAPPRPGPIPDAWLGWSNDAFGGGIGDNTDDYRTSSFNGGLALDERWLVAIDFSLLTAKEGTPPGRSDELTATLGWLVVEGGARGLQPMPWLALGAGVRMRGDLGGEDAQNRWHRHLDVELVDYLDYEDGGVDGVGYAIAGWTRLLPGLWHGDRLALDMDAAVLGTTGGLVQGEADLKLTILGRDGSIWFGGRALGTAGSSRTDPTARAVADHEDGLWLVYGAGIGGWFVDAGLNPVDRASLGRVGWMWGRRAGREPPLDGELSGDFGVYEGISLGVDLRWRPRWLTDLPAGRLLRIAASYRFGRTETKWEDSEVVFRQGTAGMELAPATGPGWAIEPFLRVGLGLREERVIDGGPQPRYREESAITGVLAGSAGVRILLPSRAERVRYGLGMAVDGWLPFQSEPIANATQSARYNEEAVAAGATLTATVSW